jgi:hypothetical protein
MSMSMSISMSRSTLWEEGGIRRCSFKEQTSDACTLKFSRLLQPTLTHPKTSVPDRNSARIRSRQQMINLARLRVVFHSTNQRTALQSAVSTRAKAAMPMLLYLNRVLKFLRKVVMKSP